MLQASSSSHPLEGVLCGQQPPDLAVPHHHHMLAVIGNVLGVVLDDDDVFP